MGFDEKLVSISPANENYPVLIVAKDKYVNLPEWIGNHKQLILRELHSSGGVLFRGFQVGSIEVFKKSFFHVCDQPVKYTHRTSPRTELGDYVYTSTDYPADQKILFHNESSYSRNWPMRIAFFCITPAAQGGETPLVDSRRVLQCLSEEVKEKFMKKGVRYIRNIDSRVGLSWQEIYQTKDKHVLESYLESEKIHFTWMGENLKLMWEMPAIHQHPVTKEWTWFNHIYFYNYFNSSTEIANSFALSELPFSAYYGDGSEIEGDVLRVLAASYESLTISFPWQENDLLILDNMLMAHGRNAFVGPRKIAVAMGDPIKN